MSKILLSFCPHDFPPPFLHFSTLISSYFPMLKRPHQPLPTYSSDIAASKPNTSAAAVVKPITTPANASSPRPRTNTRLQNTVSLSALPTVTSSFKSLHQRLQATRSFAQPTLTSLNGTESSTVSPIGLLHMLPVSSLLAAPYLSSSSTSTLPVSRSQMESLILPKPLT